MQKTLLVADDSATIQKVIKLALSGEGYNILAVSDGKEALNAIPSEKPDVVLIDVALPDADAYKVKKTINQDPNLSQIRFILLSSAFERIDEKLASEVGFDGRLVKPFDPTNLRKEVAAVLSKQAEPAVSAVLKNGDLPPIKDELPTVNEEIKPTEPVTTDEFTRPIVPMDDDIKNLTESTMQMSGLDEQAWSLDDSKKMKVPTAVPPLVVHSTPTLVTENTDNVIASPTRLNPAEIFSARPSEHFLDDGGSSFLKMENKTKVAPKPETPTVSSIPTQPAAQPMPISRAEIEELIRKDVTEILEKLAKEVVPQVAESVIRKEIERVLQER